MDRFGRVVLLLLVMLAGEEVVLGPDWTAMSSMAHSEVWTLGREGQKAGSAGTWRALSCIAPGHLPLYWVISARQLDFRCGIRAPQMGKHLLQSLPIRAQAQHQPGTTPATLLVQGIQGSCPDSRMLACTACLTPKQ